MYKTIFMYLQNVIFFTIKFTYYNLRIFIRLIILKNSLFYSYFKIKFIILIILMTMKQINDNKSIENNKKGKKMV